MPSINIDTKSFILYIISLLGALLVVKMFDPQIELSVSKKITNKTMFEKLVESIKRGEWARNLARALVGEGASEDEYNMVLDWIARKFATRILYG